MVTLLIISTCCTEAMALSMHFEEIISIENRLATLFKYTASYIRPIGGGYARLINLEIHIALTCLVHKCRRLKIDCMLKCKM